jgi:hypothetical protein
VLGLVQRIAAAAADAWRSGELRGAMQNLPQLLGGAPSLKDPTNWQRLRATVAEPLAADAPQGVDDAEQLAAARCATVGLPATRWTGRPTRRRAGGCSGARPRAAAPDGAVSALVSLHHSSFYVFVKLCRPTPCSCL